MNAVNSLGHVLSIINVSRFRIKYLEELYSNSCLAVQSFYVALEEVVRQKDFRDHSPMAVLRQLEKSHAKYLSS